MVKRTFLSEKEYLRARNKVNCKELSNVFPGFMFISVHNIVTFLSNIYSRSF